LTAHPGKILPELARHAILTYRQIRELVLDPMCGIGTTLVEAVLGRRAIGVELEPRRSHSPPPTSPLLAISRRPAAASSHAATHDSFHAGS
jgi:hypothetical protein